MTAVADVQHLWQKLPGDIWSQIFSCLPTYNYRPFDSALSLDDASPESWLSRSTCSPLQISQDCTQYQRQVLNLGTVCRAFDTVLSANPQLYASLALNKQSIAEAAGSLEAVVQWTAQHSKTVEHIVACGHMGVLHHVLNALQTPLNTLTTAVVEDHTGQSVHQLAAFKNLQKLTLCGSCEDSNTLYSLQPLTHLPVLSNLALHYCTVLDLQAAEHVTSLELVQCEASCTQPRASVQSIEDMYLCHSSIDAFHVDGIYACTGLKSLVCFDSSVAAIDNAAQDFVLGEHEACIAESLTKLSSLTTLNFNLANMSCIPVLVSLEFVRIDFWPWPTDEMRFPKQLSVLTKLQSLSVCCCPSDSFCGKLSIEFDLAALQSLRRLAILGNIALKGDFKQLAAVKLFKTLDLGYISTSAPAQLKLYAKAVELGCIKPDVQILYSFERQAIVDDPEEQECECQ